MWMPHSDNFINTPLKDHMRLTIPVGLENICGCPILITLSTLSLKDHMRLTIPVGLENIVNATF